MSDVFLSYATVDLERIRPLGEALTTAGFDVWWDRKIPPGKQFQEYIAEKLDGANCVVVAWSEESVESKWVRVEVSRAWDRGLLTPVRIDRVNPPFPFQLEQAADLTDWEPGQPHEGFDRLIEAIREKCPEAHPSTLKTEPQEIITDEADQPAKDTIERTPEARSQTPPAAEEDQPVEEPAAPPEEPLVGARPDPDCEEPPADRLAAVYREAMDALHAEDWDRATDLFREITAENPLYQDARQRLREAYDHTPATEPEGQPPREDTSPPPSPAAPADHLAGTYREAMDALQAEDWDRATDLFREIIAENPLYQDARQRLREASRHRRVGKASSGRRNEEPEAATTRETTHLITGLLDETGLKYRQQGDLTIVPFKTEHRDDLSVFIRLLNDGDLTTFAVALPDVPTGKRGRRSTFQHLLRLAYRADYIKPMLLGSGDILLVSELPTETVTPKVIEGLARGLAALGDVGAGDVTDGEGWDLRVRQCRLAQAAEITIDQKVSLHAARKSASSAGVSFENKDDTGIVVKFDIARAPIKATLRAYRRVVSCIAGFGDMKPSGLPQLERLLEMNRTADVAKVGVDGDGDIAFLYEVPSVAPGLVKRIEGQFSLLLVGLLAMRAAD